MPNEQNGNENSGGAQRLWWRDELANESAAGAWRSTPPQVGAGEQGAVAAQQVAMPVLVNDEAATEADTWAELESEAARRAGAALRAETENITIYVKNRHNGARNHKRMMWALGAVAALQAVIAVSLLMAGSRHVPFMNIFMFLFLIAEMVVLSKWVGAQARALESSPYVTLSPQGIEVYGVGLVYWNEVKEIRSGNVMALTPCVSIFPKDFKALCERLGPTRLRALRLDAKFGKYFRGYVPTINLPEQFLPFKSDELVKRIEEYRAGLTNTGD